MTASHPTSPSGRAYVDPSSFTAAEELQRWQDALDRRGLRATGSPAHEDYVADLARRLSEAGVSDVHLEAVPMRRWTPTRWGLAADDVAVPVLSPVAYSGATGPDGVTGPLSGEPAAGTIGVVQVPATALTSGVFDALDWDAPDGDHTRDPDTPYVRLWLSQDQMREQLTRFGEAGAVGLVIVVDAPEEHVRQGYLLYDGVHRGLPAVFVSQEGAGALELGVALGLPGRLVLEAEVEQVDTHTVVGVVPGAGDEVVVLQSHTDGTNGLEDNGPEAIMAMATHLAALPAADLPRGVLVLLTTGHFAIEEAWGVEAWLARHASDVVPRIAAVLSLEHLGARVGRGDRESLPDAPEHEFGCSFTSPHLAVVDVVRSAMRRAEVTEARVLRPFVPDTTGRSPDGTTWPGDGGPFWHTAGLPTANFITGPDYLLNVEPVAEFIDVAALRRQAIAFTEATLELCALPWDVLHRRMEG